MGQRATIKSHFHNSFKRKGLDVLSTKDKHIIADELKSDLKDLKNELKTRYGLTRKTLKMSREQ
jgi:hypothetical protein